MNTLSLIHRILGETMLLIALVGVILAIVGLVRKKEIEKPERLFGIVYTALLDIQTLLGIIQFVYILTLPGNFLLFPFLLHPVFMILAVVVVHASRAWRNSAIPTRHRAQLIVYGLSLLLIFAGRIIVA